MANSEQHARPTIPAECRGEACPNYKGSPCSDTYFDWMGAKATVTTDRDMEQTPFVGETIFITYAQVCISGKTIEGLRYRVDDYGYERFSYEQTGLIVHGDSRFGSGIDVDVYDVRVDDNGVLTEDLRHTFDGWG